MSDSPCREFEHAFSVLRRLKGARDAGRAPERGVSETGSKGGRRLRAEDLSGQHSLPSGPVMEPVPVTGLTTNFLAAAADRSAAIQRQTRQTFRLPHCVAFHAHAAYRPPLPAFVCTGRTIRGGVQAPAEGAR
jgi:hypothetical protein